MGNTSSERAGVGQGDKAHRRDSRGAKEGECPKILMDSPEDADIFHGEDIKASAEKGEFLTWQPDLEHDDSGTIQDRPTVFRWTGVGKEVFVSGSFNNWTTKIPLIRSQNNFVAIVGLPEGEHQYKFFVDGQWTHDPTEPVVTSQLGTVNNVIQVKKTDFEVFDALMVDSQKSSDMSDLSSSPPGPYHQDPYMPKQEEGAKGSDCRPRENSSSLYEGGGVSPHQAHCRGGGTNAVRYTTAVEVFKRIILEAEKMDGGAPQGRTSCSLM